MCRFAINIIHELKYPVEQRPINEGYKLLHSVGCPPGAPATRIGTKTTQVTGTTVNSIKDYATNGDKSFIFIVFIDTFMGVFDKHFNSENRPYQTSPFFY